MVLMEEGPLPGKSGWERANGSLDWSIPCYILDKYIMSYILSIWSCDSSPPCIIRSTVLALVSNKVEWQPIAIFPVVAGINKIEKLHQYSTKKGIHVNNQTHEQSLQNISTVHPRYSSGTGVFATWWSSISQYSEKSARLFLHIGQLGHTPPEFLSSSCNIIYFLIKIKNTPRFPSIVMYKTSTGTTNKM